MPRLRALFHFDVGELWVRTEELGSVFDIGAGSVRIALPGGDAAFVLAEDRHGNRDDPFTGSAIGRRLELGHEMVGVRIIQIAVDLDGDVRASDFDQGHPTPIPGETRPGTRPTQSLRVPFVASCHGHGLSATNTGSPSAQTHRS